MEAIDAITEMTGGLQGNEGTDGKTDQVDRRSEGHPGNRLGQGAKIRLAFQRPVEGEPVEADEVQAMFFSQTVKQRSFAGRAGRTVEINDDPASLRTELPVCQGRIHVTNSSFIGIWITPE